MCCCHIMNVTHVTFNHVHALLLRPTEIFSLFHWKINAQFIFSRTSYKMENIFTVSKPFLTLARLIGLFPATYQQSSNKKYFKVSIHGIFFTCCSISISSYLVIANYIDHNRPPNKQSEISSISQVFMRNFELFAYLLLCIYQVSKWRKVVEFLKMIEKADNEVSFWLWKSLQF